MRSRVFILLVLMLGMAGCFSVKYSFKGFNISPDVKTVSVQFFSNNAPIVNPTLGQQLTNTLREKIQSVTNLTLVNGTGDVDFEGTITDYSQSPVAVQGNNLAAQNRFVITVKVKFVNNKDEKTNYDASFSYFVDYASSKTFEQAQVEYTQEILDQLVEQILNKAFANW